MITNKALLNKKSFLKAMKALPDMTLLPQEADRFIDYVIDQSTWKNNARIVKMAKNEKNIRYLGFGSGRFMKPADQFSVTDYKKEFASGKVTLTTKKVRGAIEIYDDDLEDGIEGQAFADHLMKIIAKKTSNEFDEASYVSNSGFAATDIRSLWEGFRYKLLTYAPTGADTNNQYPLAANVLDATDTAVFDDAGRIAEQNATTFNWEFKFAKMLSTLPSKYKLDGLKNLRFFCNDIVVQDYINALAARSTILGDNAILGNSPLSFGTVPIVSVPLMPTTYVTGATGLEDYEAGAVGNIYTDVILTHKDNFIIGLQRDLKLESQRVPEDEAQRIFYSMRMDLNIENPNAACILHDLTHS